MKARSGTSREDWLRPSRTGLRHLALYLGMTCHGPWVRIASFRALTSRKGFVLATSTCSSGSTRLVTWLGSLERTDVAD